jgi:hypothetical protein
MKTSLANSKVSPRRSAGRRREESHLLRDGEDGVTSLGLESAIHLAQPEQNKAEEQERLEKEERLENKERLENR